ncbi:hypothetical protein PMAYCL1PPCAC_01474, partial [Pristionchus mayeri]
MMNSDAVGSSPKRTREEEKNEESMEVDINFKDDQSIQPIVESSNEVMDESGERKDDSTEVKHEEPLVDSSANMMEIPPPVDAVEPTEIRDDAMEGKDESIDNHTDAKEEEPRPDICCSSTETSRTLNQSTPVLYSNETSKTKDSPAESNEGDGKLLDIGKEEVKPKTNVFIDALLAEIDQEDAQKPIADVVSSDVAMATVEPKEDLIGVKPEDLIVDEGAPTSSKKMEKKMNSKSQELRNKNMNSEDKSTV